MSRKEKMTKKNKEGAAFTDDGFAMGMICCVLYFDFELRRSIFKRSKITPVCTV